jgi:hypothetical protein
MLFDTDDTGVTSVAYENVQVEDANFSNVEIFKESTNMKCLLQPHSIPGARLWVSSISPTRVAVVASLPFNKHVVNARAVTPEKPFLKHLPSTEDVMQRQRTTAFHNAKCNSCG